MRILITGDFHIPTRARDIPEQIASKMREKSYDLILCTGDLTSERMLEKLSEIAPVKYVVGNMDYIDGPFEEKITVGDITIGLIHGTEIYPRGDINKLYNKAVKMGVDILVSGHTHSLNLCLRGGKLFLNPGSATGVWGGGPASLRPSFIALEIKGRAIKVECLELKGGKLIEREFLFRKKGENVISVK